MDAQLQSRHVGYYSKRQDALSSASDAQNTHQSIWDFIQPFRFSVAKQFVDLTWNSIGAEETVTIYIRLLCIAVTKSCNCDMQTIKFTKKTVKIDNINATTDIQNNKMIKHKWE